MKRVKRNRDVRNKLIVWYLGTLIINSSIIDIKPERTDIDVYYINADDLARKAGNSKTVNSVMLGAFCAIKNIYDTKIIYRIFDELFAKNPNLIDVNKAAFELGLKEIIK